MQCKTNVAGDFPDFPKMTHWAATFAVNHLDMDAANDSLSSYLEIQVCTGSSVDQLIRSL